MNRFKRILAQAAIPVAACFFAEAQPAPLPVTGKAAIHWNMGRGNSANDWVEVRLLPGQTLRTLETAGWTREEWQKAFAVYVETEDIVGDIDLPPMAGSYEVAKDTLRFEPRFPFAPGVSYRAVVRLSRLPGFGAGEPPVSSVHRVPRPEQPSATVVSAVFPSAEVLPENLLKFYLHFSAPMSGGRIYEHIRLLDEAGSAVELPFLEIDEELWDPEMTRLTLFIDPGRIKRGVRPLEEIGPALEDGRSYTLVVDRAWRDANGQPLKETFRKRFRVGPPDREAIQPDGWKIETPLAGSRSPLTVDFGEPLDHALALRMIRVADGRGQVVRGDAQLVSHERRWRFTPDTPWASGPHKLVLQTNVEDLAGNNIGKPFEVDLFERVERRVTNETVEILFSTR